MPVECSIAVERIEQERFHAIDRAVMGQVFAIHNDLGRFCDERVYQDVLAQRCRDEGFEVEREAMVRVSHGDFVKAYYLDLLVERRVVCELKAVEALNAAHEKQLINYLLLTDLGHGKLVNFRAGSVESRFVSTTLRREDRMAFGIDVAFWCGEDGKSRELEETFRALLADWGAFLDVNLYHDALLHFLGGPGAGVQPVEIRVNRRVVGSQKMCLLDDDTAWHLSAVRRHFGSYETHLSRLLNHTKLRRIHWINLDHQNITLKTIHKNDSTANDSVQNDYAVNDSAVNDSAVNDSAVNDSAVNDSAVNDSAVNDSAVNDSVQNDSAVKTIPSPFLP